MPSSSCKHSALSLSTESCIRTAWWHSHHCHQRHHIIVILSSQSLPLSSMHSAFYLHEELYNSLVTSSSSSPSSDSYCHIVNIIIVVIINALKQPQALSSLSPLRVVQGDIVIIVTIWCTTNVILSSSSSSSPPPMWYCHHRHCHVHTAQDLFPTVWDLSDRKSNHCALVPHPDHDDPPGSRTLALFHSNGLQCSVQLSSIQAGGASYILELNALPTQIIFTAWLRMATFSIL